MLIVNQEPDGRFVCHRDTDVGMRVEGRGASVLEAVGSWLIYSGDHHVKCEPPAVLREFSISNPYSDLTFLPSPKRD